MSPERIAELAREAEIDKAYWLVDGSPVHTFANAVIAERDKELIEGAGEPAIKEAKFGGYDAYTAAQVAGAVAKLKADSDFDYSEYKRLRDEKDKRITTLESTLKLALGALETIEWDSPRWCWVDADAVKEALKQIKEVLHESS